MECPSPDPSIIRRGVLRGAAGLACLESGPGQPCYGRFPNPFTDVCWKRVFPVRIGSLEMDIGIEATGDSLPPIGACPAPPQVFVRFGLGARFWEPARVAENGSKPRCNLADEAGSAAGTRAQGLARSVRNHSVPYVTMPKCTAPSTASRDRPRGTASQWGPAPVCRCASSAVSVRHRETGRVSSRFWSALTRLGGSDPTPDLPSRPNRTGPALPSGPPKEGRSRCTGRLPRSPEGPCPDASGSQHSGHLDTGWWLHGAALVQRPPCPMLPRERSRRGYARRVRGLRHRAGRGDPEKRAVSIAG
jgi:hypothetical protein